MGQLYVVDPQKQRAVPIGTMPEVMHLKAPRFPHLRFEYHQRAKKVYLIRAGVLTDDGKETAAIIAHDVADEGAAHNAVLIFLRGYAAAKAEIL